jgi:hypothetical protein
MNSLNKKTNFKASRTIIAEEVVQAQGKIVIISRL